jgi:hypothetical protein
MGLIADLIGVNRTLLEEVRWRLRDLQLRQDMRDRAEEAGEQDGK